MVPCGMARISNMGPSRGVGSMCLDVSDAATSSLTNDCPIGAGRRQGAVTPLPTGLLRPGKGPGVPKPPRREKGGAPKQRQCTGDGNEEGGGCGGPWRWGTW